MSERPVTRPRRAGASAGDVPWARLAILEDPAFGGLDVHDLAAEFGTPFYVYDLDVVTARVEMLRRALPAGGDLAYAVKANPSLAVVAHLVALGLGMDIASAGEIATVLRAGVSPDAVVFTGPGKTDAELAAALDAGIGTLTIESLQELDRLLGLLAARDVASLQRLMLRVQASDPREERRLIGDGGRGKFGLTIDELDAAAVIVESRGHARIVGIHAFGASNVREADVLLAHLDATARVAAAFATRHGIELERIDAGGGLGIPYADAEQPLDLARLRDGLERRVAAWRSEPGLRRARLLIEPGRFLVGPAGAYVSRVTATKERAAGRVVVIDGGIHHLVRPALVGQEQRMVLLPSPTGPARGAAGAGTVVGPLCTGLDILADGTLQGDARPGDLIAVLDAGAYGFTESMPYFLSHAQPAEVVVRGGHARLARPRLDARDVLARQLIPTW